MAFRTPPPRRAQKGSPEQYDTVMDEVMKIAWEAAPLAMKIISEAAADGDINAAYYLVNRTMGRPPEALKEHTNDDYADLLRDLRAKRSGAEGAQQPGANDRGEAPPVEAGGVPPESAAVGSTHEPGEAEADSGRGTWREKLLSGDGAGRQAPPG